MGGKVDAWARNYLIECNRQYSVLVEERPLGTTAILFAIAQFSQEAMAMRDIRVKGKIGSWISLSKFALVGFIYSISKISVLNIALL